MNRKKKYLLIVVLSSILCLGCAEKTSYVRTEGMIWNTLYHITYKGPKSLRDSILPVLNEVSRSLSVFDKSSLISELNNSDSVKADSHLIKVYDESKRISKISGGNFDPTISPLIDAWGFGPDHRTNPDTLAIDSILLFVGIEKTKRKGEFIYKNDTRTRFNFSAIAKGYGCDAVGEMFKRNGVEDYMVEIGGEISLSGKSPSGSKWRISVDAPKEGIKPGEESTVILELTDVGIATSGNYRNFREENGKKLAHTISPITGKPYVNSILSATVVSSTCMEADALATACMAGKPEEAEKLLRETKSEGMLIFEDSLWMTPGFKKYIQNY